MINYNNTIFLSYKIICWLGLYFIMFAFNFYFNNCIGQESSAIQLLKQMIYIASDNGGSQHLDELNAIRNQIDKIQKPQKASREKHSKARKSNDIGLIKYKDKKYEEAKKYFLSARKYDPSDVEIANNLASTYSKLGEYDQAINEISSALEISPARSIAWADLADIFAVQDKPKQAVACYSLALHFSRNQDKTRDWLSTSIKIFKFILI
jgi:tetratricopeptide (TPR) repeat protein